MRKALSALPTETASEYVEGHPLTRVALGYSVDQQPAGRKGRSSMSGPDRLLKLLRELIGRGRRWHGLQSYLSEQLGVPLRTLQRWTAELRSKNKIVTRQWIDSRGYRHMNIYELVEVDHGGPEVVKDVVSSISSSTSYGRNALSQNNPYGSSKPKQVNIHMRKITPTASQPGLFDDVNLDERPTSSDNDHDKAVSTGARKGSPASRSVTYWLSGRRERPPGHMIAAIGRTIKQCFETNADLTEIEMHDVIDSLLMRGLDLSPRHYFAGCLVRPKTPPKPRDYEKNPLWKHHPRQSSMKPGGRTTPAPSPSPGMDVPSPSMSESSTSFDTSPPPWPGPSTLSTGANTARNPQETPDPFVYYRPRSTTPTISSTLTARPMNAAETYRHVQLQRELDDPDIVLDVVNGDDMWDWLESRRSDGSPST